MRAYPFKLLAVIGCLHMLVVNGHAQIYGTKVNKQISNPVLGSIQQEGVMAPESGSSFTAQALQRVGLPLPWTDKIIYEYHHVVNTDLSQSGRVVYSFLDGAKYSNDHTHHGAIVLFYAKPEKGVIPTWKTSYTFWFEESTGIDYGNYPKTYWIEDAYSTTADPILPRVQIFYDDASANAAMWEISKAVTGFEDYSERNNGLGWYLWSEKSLELGPDWYLIGYGTTPNLPNKWWAPNNQLIEGEFTYNKEFFSNAEVKAYRYEFFTDKDRKGFNVVYELWAIAQEINLGRLPSSATVPPQLDLTGSQGEVELNPPAAMGSAPKP